MIVVAGTPSALAAKRATMNMPIVIAGLADPVGAGLVASLARPGGNATGLSIITTDIGAKWIELLREIAPGAKRIAFLTDASNKGAQLVFARLEEHARRIDVTVRLFDGRQREALGQSFDAIARERFDGLVVSATAVLLEHRDRIVQLRRMRGFLRFTQGANRWTRAGSFRAGPPIRSFTRGPPNTCIGSLRGQSPRSCPWSSRTSCAW